MVRYGQNAVIAVIIFSAFSSTNAFGVPKRTIARQQTTTQLATSLDYDQAFPDKSKGIRDALQKVGEATMESLSQEDEEYETELAERKRMVEQRCTGTYSASLPIDGSKELGVVLSQINKGFQMREVSLGMDTLGSVQTAAAQDDSSMEYVTLEDLSKRLREEFRGVVVTAISKDGAGWNAGIRPGDVLISTSATVGDVSLVLFCQFD